MGLERPSTLGDGTTLDRLRPLTGTGAPGAVALAGGAWHSLSLRADGTVWAWGWNAWGQLGDGTTTIRSTPVQVKGLTDVVAVAAGAYHSLALRSDGTVWAWGWNGVGQLGTGSTMDSPVPMQVQGLSGVTAISAGFHHNLAVRPDGTVAAWGWNVLGQLGDGTTTDRWRPQAVPGLTGVTAVAGGALHSLALATDGRVRAWGLNNVAQLGTGDLVDRHTPAQVQSISDIVSIASGAFTITPWSRTAKCAPGAGTPSGSWATPRPAYTSGNLNVWNLDDVASISSGWYHGLAIRHDGSVVTWGWNALGQLGDGTTRDRWQFAPVAVPPAIAVAGGALHTLVGLIQAEIPRHRVSATRSGRSSSISMPVTRKRCMSRATTPSATSSGSTSARTSPRSTPRRTASSTLARRGWTKPSRNAWASSGLRDSSATSAGMTRPASEVRRWCMKPRTKTRRSSRADPVSGGGPALSRQVVTASTTRADLHGHRRYTVALPTPARAATPSIVTPP